MSNPLKNLAAKRKASTENSLRKFYGITAESQNSERTFFFALAYKDKAAFEREAMNYLKKFSARFVTSLKNNPKKIPFGEGNLYGADVEVSKPEMFLFFTLGYINKTLFKRESAGFVKRYIKYVIATQPTQPTEV